MTSIWLIDDVEYMKLKVQLSHIVSSDRTEVDVIDLSRKTLSKRRCWIKNESPTAAEILKQFPRLLDTPRLVWYTL